MGFLRKDKAHSNQKHEKKKRNRQKREQKIHMIPSISVIAKIINGLISIDYIQNKD